MDMSITGEQIRAARERLRMTQDELAKEVGVSMRTIGNWERGESVPRNRMAALEEALAGHLEPSRRAPMIARLGQLARQRREEIGLGRSAVASRAGVKSDTTIQNFEYGRNLPMPVYQNAIEEVLDWRKGVIEELVNRSDIEPSEVSMEMLDAPARDQHVSSGSLRDVSLDELLGELRRRVVEAQEKPLPNLNADPFPSAQDEVELAARNLIRDTKRRKSIGNAKEFRDTPENDPA